MPTHFYAAASLGFIACWSIILRINSPNPFGVHRRLSIITHCPHPGSSFSLLLGTASSGVPRDASHDPRAVWMRQHSYAFLLAACPYFNSCFPHCTREEERTVSCPCCAGTRTEPIYIVSLPYHSGNLSITLHIPQYLLLAGELLICLTLSIFARSPCCRGAGLAYFSAVCTSNCLLSVSIHSSPAPNTVN
ncbi:hypothetical protein B0H11DRAFT_905214 [Mycena galericulata]|nr:hypothetical protein B0H11DRAFT_905214 [Mycena galericulata]